MKRVLLYLALLLAIAALMCACVSTGVTSQEVQQAPATFSYVHDPRLCAEAMRDIVENPDAVYGFSPDPESTRLGPYAQYDWTDPVFVAQAKEDR
ncbi:MAG: hypothetical protein II962_06265, partial [Spirochaetales bacterium]|nr:hypothetical protein [Spirochaetales bacterium]